VTLFLSWCRTKGKWADFLLTFFGQIIGYNNRYMGMEILLLSARAGLATPAGSSVGQDFDGEVRGGFFEPNGTGRL
jgi:hypothetical protein